MTTTELRSLLERMASAKPLNVGDNCGDHNALVDHTAETLRLVEELRAAIRDLQRANFYHELIALLNHFPEG